MGSNVTKFKRKHPDLRTKINGVELLSKINDNFRALEKIDDELEAAIQDFEREVLDENGEVIRTEHYRSTVLDKETIAVYHTRQAGRKMQIDACLRMLNKVLPDLRAVEKTKDVHDKAAMALAAFAKAAEQ